MIPPSQLLVHFGGLCCTGQEGWQKAPKRLARPTIKVMLSARRRTNRQLGMVRTRAAEQPPRCRGESELNLSIGTRSGSRRCRRLRPVNDDGPWHRRTGSHGPDGYRIVVGCRLRETACQYRFRWRSLVWPHRLGDGRRLRRYCGLKPTARYKPSRRGPFISSVGRGRRGQAAHDCCHSGC